VEVPPSFPSGGYNRCINSNGNTACHFVDQELFYILLETGYPEAENGLPIFFSMVLKKLSDIP
jgi:hypothetical protein